MPAWGENLTYWYVGLGETVLWEYICSYVVKGEFKRPEATMEVRNELYDLFGRLVYGNFWKRRDRISFQIGGGIAGRNFPICVVPMFVTGS